eukprot:CAMPEP_0119570156 /NCGR_PEP_ID=MMETSP1352-20130426/43471_1 /TAXON_ID=265584 /ORGANISM="Stauroneis constricta, Strain CCMP1120" /LENGTH=489 /DNA_ID=CAMNT_0007619821 /DNA_START=252 /DNA_END=1721 /DNA_ORIENTATION=+
MYQVQECRHHHFTTNGNSSSSMMMVDSSNNNNMTSSNDNSSQPQSPRRQYYPQHYCYKEEEEYLNDRSAHGCYEHDDDDDGSVLDDDSKTFISTGDIEWDVSNLCLRTRADRSVVSELTTHTPTPTPSRRYQPRQAVTREPSLYPSREQMDTMTSDCNVAKLLEVAKRSTRSIYGSDRNLHHDRNHDRMNSQQYQYRRHEQDERQSSCSSPDRWGNSSARFIDPPPHSPHSNKNNNWSQPAVHQQRRQSSGISTYGGEKQGYDAPQSRSSGGGIYAYDKSESFRSIRNGNGSSSSSNNNNESSRASYYSTSKQEVRSMEAKLKDPSKYGFDEENDDADFNSNNNNNNEYDGNNSSYYPQARSSHHHSRHPESPNPVSCLDEHDQQTNASGKSRALTIEVTPGVYLPLRGSKETLEAVEWGFASRINCMGCSISLGCVPDCQVVICPECRFMSPMYGDDAVAKKERYQSWRMKSYGCIETEGGVGLGLRI